MNDDVVENIPAGCEFGLIDDENILKNDVLTLLSNVAHAFNSFQSLPIEIYVTNRRLKLDNLKQ